MSTFIWIPGSGRIEIEIEFADLDQCRRVSHPGPCDLDVADLSTEPSIAAQLAAIDPALLRAELQEYGWIWRFFERMRKRRSTPW